jgi:pheromone a factor receptor
MFSALGSVLCVLTGYVNYKSTDGPLATGILAFWIFSFNFLSFLDSIIWGSGNSEQWWDGKIYCDINSRIKSAVPIGIPGAAIGLCRFLADTTSQHILQQDVHKPRSVFIDCFLGLILPFINAVLKFVVTPSRYIISGVNGCTGVTDDSWPAIPLYWLWPPVLSVVAAIYAGILVHIHY